VIGPQKMGTTYHLVRVKDWFDQGDSLLSRLAHLKEVIAEQSSAFFRVSWVVHLREVILLRPLRPPHLNEKRFREIEEMVAVKVGERVGLIRVEVFPRDPVCENKHDDRVPHSLLTLRDDLLVAAKFPHLVILHHVVCISRVHMMVFITHDLADVFPGIFHEDVITSWVIWEEWSDIVD